MGDLVCPFCKHGGPNKKYVAGIGPRTIDPDNPERWLPGEVFQQTHNDCNNCMLMKIYEVATNPPVWVGDSATAEAREIAFEDEQRRRREAAAIKDSSS
jgi:hypothetical protein